MVTFLDLYVEMTPHRISKILDYGKAPTPCHKPYHEYKGWKDVDRRMKEAKRNVVYMLTDHDHNN